MNLKWLRDQQVRNIRWFFQRKKTDMHRAVVRADNKSLTTARLQEREPDGEDGGARVKRGKQDAELEAQWRAKVLHGRCPHKLHQEEVDQDASLMWITDSFLYSKTESFVIAIQDRVKKTRKY